MGRLNSISSSAKIEAEFRVVKFIILSFLNPGCGKPIGPAMYDNKS
jgi:hypothetical protein